MTKVTTDKLTPTSNNDPDGNTFGAVMNAPMPEKRRPLAYSHSFDGKQWIVTEEFVDYYVVIAEFTTQTDARNYIKTISNRGHR